MTWGIFGTYLVFVVLLVLAPGPDTMVVLKNSLAGGRGAGLATCVGVVTSNLLQGTAAALGVGALIVRSQPVFDAVRIVGAAYLCWLGVQALRSAIRGGSLSALSVVHPDRRSHLRRCRQGFLSNVTNPKVLAMYLSVLPQFLNAHTTTADALLLAYTVGVLGLVWQLLLVVVVHRARTWLQRRRVRRGMDTATGVALVGFGAALALDSH